MAAKQTNGWLHCNCTSKLIHDTGQTNILIHALYVVNSAWEFLYCHTSCKRTVKYLSRLSRMMTTALLYKACKSRKMMQMRLLNKKSINTEQNTAFWNLMTAYQQSIFLVVWSNIHMCLFCTSSQDFQQIYDDGVIVRVIMSRHRTRAETNIE